MSSTPTAPDLAALLAAGDVTGIRRLFHAGGLQSLRTVVSPTAWAELPSRVDRGDLGWLRATLGPVVDRVGHVSTATALGFEAPRIGTDAADALTPIPGRRRAAPSAATGGVANGPVGAGVAGSRAAAPPDEGRRGAWSRWIVPAVAALALLAAALSRCDGSNEDIAARTTIAPATTPTTTPATTATTVATTVATTSTVATTTVATTTAPEPTVTLAPAATDLLTTAAGIQGLATFRSALDTAQLSATLAEPGPFTVFAPTDAAFAQLDAATFDAIKADPAVLQKVLQYHVVAGARPAATLTTTSLATIEGESLPLGRAGEAITVGSARITTADVAATNGVLHVVDRVLLPPGLRLGPVGATAKDLVQVLTESGKFTTLLDLVSAAGLTEVLTGPGPYTLLAPLDEAFAKLPAGAVDQLKADKAALTKLLTYHVLPGATKATDMNLGGNKTVEGDTVDVGRANGKVTFDGNATRLTDAPANNGFIDVVDTVLVPGDTDLSAILGAPTPAPAAPEFVVFFDTDAAVIRPDAADTIARAAKLIKKGSKVVLTGVADTRGTPDKNVELSDRRANAVAAALRAAGADAIFEIRAKGAEPNADLQQARRVEIDL